MDGNGGACRSEREGDDVDGPSHGWFTVDLRRVLDDLKVREREDVVARISSRAAVPDLPRPGRLPPGGVSRRVPDEAIVVVGQDVAGKRPAAAPPAGEVVAYPGRFGARRARTLALAALLALGLLGLAVQNRPQPPAIVVPVSLDARIVVT